jgi:hypothetical protein
MPLTEEGIAGPEFESLRLAAPSGSMLG